MLEQGVGHNQLRREKLHEALPGDFAIWADFTNGEAADLGVRSMPEDLGQIRVPNEAILVSVQDPKRHAKNVGVAADVI